MSRLARHQFAQQSTGRRSHAQTQHAMSGRDPNVAQRGTAINDRFSIPGHRPPAIPGFFDGLAHRIMKVFCGRFSQQAQSTLVNGRVPADELHR